MQLVKWDEIKYEIETAKDWDTLQSLSDKVKAFQIWAKQTKQSLETQNQIAVYRLRLERTKGNFLEENVPHGGDRKSEDVKIKVDKLDLDSLGITKNESSTARQIAKIPEAKFEAFIQQKLETVDQAMSEITIAGALRLAKGAHVSNNSGENEWYTPPQYIESARKVMGIIDLDPASSECANGVVKAKKYFDEESNGLFQAWKGSIWMNPPYAQPLIFDFILKLETEVYDQAIVLVNNATETKWGQKLLELSNAVCFHTGRIRFVSPDGELGDAPLQGQIIAYIGKNYKEFINEFKQYGICLRKGV